MGMGDPRGSEERPVHPTVLCPALGEDGVTVAATALASVGGGRLTRTSPLPAPPGPSRSPGNALPHSCRLGLETPVSVNKPWLPVLPCKEQGQNRRLAPMFSPLFLCHLAWVLYLLFWGRFLVLSTRAAGHQRSPCVSLQSPRNRPGLAPARLRVWDPKPFRGQLLPNTRESPQRNVVWIQATGHEISAPERKFSSFSSQFSVSCTFTPASGSRSWLLPLTGLSIWAFGLFRVRYAFRRSALCNNFPKKTVSVAITLLYNQVHRAWKHFVIVLKQQRQPWGTTQGTGINWLPPLSDC